MMPSMTYFQAALSAPALHFKRLGKAEPLLHNGHPIVRRTYSAIETEIMLNGQRFLLFLPFKKEYILHIDKLESVTQERSRGPLLENRILYEELKLVDSLGNTHEFDVILQEFPQGMTLKEAVFHYRGEALKEAVRKMKARIDAVGFRHNNLTPSNVLICKSGVARPLRYWYASWELFSDNDISPLLDFIDQNSLHDADDRLHDLVVRDSEAEYVAKPDKYNEVTRLCKGHRYGFVDCDGRQITPFIYTWASEFQEGRAIVVKNGKMGAIDIRGRKVLHTIFKTLEFDVETGIFTATRDKYLYLFDYDGDKIRQINLQKEEEKKRKEESLTVNF